MKQPSLTAIFWLTILISWVVYLVLQPVVTGIIFIAVLVPLLGFREGLKVRKK